MYAIRSYYANRRPPQFLFVKAEALGHGARRLSGPALRLALPNGLDTLIHQETGISVSIAESPLDCVVLGTGKVLEEIEVLKKVLIQPKRFS